MTMNVTNRGGIVMRFATALMVIAVLGMASSAQAVGVFFEDFDGGQFSDGGDVVGNNGWVQSGFRGVTIFPRPSSKLTNAPSAPDGLTSGLAAMESPFVDPGSAFARDISGNITNDEILVTFDMGGGGQTRVTLGGSDIFGSGSNDHILVQFNNASGDVSFNGQTGGSRVPDIGPTVPGPGFQGAAFQARIQVNKLTTETSADYRLLPTDTWTNIFTETPGLALYTGITAIGFNQGNDAWVDNISIGVPEPTSMSLLVLGGLVMLMRRRRRG